MAADQWRRAARGRGGVTLQPATRAGVCGCVTSCTLALIPVTTNTRCGKQNVSCRGGWMHTLGLGARAAAANEGLLCTRCCRAVLWLARGVHLLEQLCLSAPNLMNPASVQVVVTNADTRTQACASRAHIHTHQYLFRRGRYADARALWLQGGCVRASPVRLWYSVSSVCVYGGGSWSAGACVPGAPPPGLRPSPL